MQNLRTAPTRRPSHRPRGVQIGADHIDALYLAPARLRARRGELATTGYRPHAITLVLRLEGRENTLLDALADGTDPHAETELRVVQRMLDTMQDEAKASRAARAEASA